MEPKPYAIRRTVAMSYEEAVTAARNALAAEGFGVLTEIDVQAKMKEKLDKDMPPYLILGACAPLLAWQALGAEKDLGVLLPCNVCVYIDGEETVVSAMEPAAVLGLIGNPLVDAVGHEVSQRLHRVLDGI